MKAKFSFRTPSGEWNIPFIGLLCAISVVVILGAHSAGWLPDDGSARAHVAGTIGALRTTSWEGSRLALNGPAWFDDGNWDNRTPSKNVNVTIGKGRATGRLDAEIPPPDGGRGAEVRDLTVHQGGRLTFATFPSPGSLTTYGNVTIGYKAELALGSGTMTVHSDLTVDKDGFFDGGQGTLIVKGSTVQFGSAGSFFAGNSSVVMNGSADQYVLGEVSFATLDVRTPDTVHIVGHVTVTQYLGLGSSTVVIVERGGVFRTPSSSDVSSSVIDLNGITSNRTTTLTAPAKSASSIVPSTLELKPNFPNPFNPSTTIEFSVGRPDQTSLKVFDIQGREIRTLFDAVAEPSRTYRVTFDGTGLSSGTYVYVLHSGEERRVGRMTLMK